MGDRSLQVPFTITQGGWIGCEQLGNDDAVISKVTPEFAPKLVGSGLDCKENDRHGPFGLLFKVGLKPSRLRYDTIAGN
jgi:hypothetical protein